MIVKPRECNLGYSKVSVLHAMGSFVSKWFGSWRRSELGTSNGLTNKSKDFSYEAFC